MLGTKILYKRKSKHNGELRVLKTFGMGTYIQAGGLTQSGGIVETIWKQTLKKIPNSKFQNPNCLILGLGGGTVAKLIRKKWWSSKITGVEIDIAMIELGKKYLNLEKTGVDIRITNALKFISHKSSSINHYDLIIVDLYNGDKFPEKFETIDYINIVKKNLSRQGVAVFNMLYYGDKRPKAVKFGNRLKKVFKDVEWFYPEANLMLICKK